MVIKDSFPELYHLWQNPVKTAAIRWLKKTPRNLMDMTGCPEPGWLCALKYIALVNNWIADERLGWETPYFKRYGTTLYILALLAFHFFQKIYYLDAEKYFPNSKEVARYIMGVAENVRDALTYWILTEQTQRIVARRILDPVNPKD